MEIDCVDSHTPSDLALPGQFRLPPGVLNRFHQLLKPPCAGSPKEASAWRLGASSFLSPALALAASALSHLAKCPSSGSGVAISGPASALVDFPTSFQRASFWPPVFAFFLRPVEVSSCLPQLPRASLVSGLPVTLGVAQKTTA